MNEGIALGQMMGGKTLYLVRGYVPHPLIPIAAPIQPMYQLYIYIYFFFIFYFFFL
jgi:hypothetical protein